MGIDKRILAECAKGYKFQNRTNLYSSMIFEKVVFLDRANGADGNDGESWDNSVKTINGAVDKFYSGVRDDARGRNYAIVFRGRLTGGNAFTTAEGQQTIDVPGVHVIGAGLIYGDGGGWDSCYVTNSQIPTDNSAHFTGTGETRAGLLIENDNCSVSGMKFYCSDETNGMMHVVVHDRDQNNDSGNSGRNCAVVNNTFQGDLDGTVAINGVALDGTESCTVANNRFYYCGTGIAFGGGGTRYANKNIIENNKIFSCGTGIKGCNASTVENLIQDNIIIAKGIYGWAITYGIDGANSSTDSVYTGNIVGHATEGTAYNYGTGNFWINNYISGSGGTLANPDA
jgi:hypothetical protein